MTFSKSESLINHKLGIMRRMDVRQSGYC